MGQKERRAAYVSRKDSRKEGDGKREKGERKERKISSE